MTISKKIAILSAATIFSILAVIAFTALTLSSLDGEFSQFQAQELIDNDLMEIKATALSVAKSDPILPQTADSLNAADTHIRKLLTAVTSTAQDKALTDAIKHVSGLWAEYIRQFDSAIKIASDSPADALQIPDAIYQSQLVPMASELDRLVATERTREKASRSSVTAAKSRVMWAVLLPLVLGGTIIVIGQLLFTRSLKGRMEAVMQVAARLEAGDLTQRLPEDGKDEFSDMARSINHFISRLQDILREMSNSSDQTRAAVQGIGTAIDSVSGNANLQSHRAREMREAMQELEQTAHATAASAAQASGAAVAMVEEVRAGNAVGSSTTQALVRIDGAVDVSVSTMTELGAAIQRVGAVSRVITDIAEQTNLLALNAAIEAARAGDTGRGFAVVADEVRKLAERTAASTGDISRIVAEIERRTGEVGQAMQNARSAASEGVHFGEQMTALLNRIEHAAVGVSGLMQEIAVAAEQQSATGSGIAQAVQAVEEASVSTMHESEQARIGSSSLTENAERLHAAASRFTV